MTNIYIIAYVYIIILSIRESYKLILYNKQTHKKAGEKHSRIHLIYMFFYIVFLAFLFLFLTTNNYWNSISSNFMLEWIFIFGFLNAFILIKHIEQERKDNFIL